MFKKVLGCLVLICCPLIFISNSWAQNCQSYWTAEYKCMQGCGPCAGGSGNSGNSNYDYGAAQRAQAAAAAAAAAAEEQRQRDAELEQQRIEAENQRRIEEIAKQKKFEEERNAAACTLRGSAGSASCGSGGSGLRGSGASGDQDATVLRGAGSLGSNVVILKGNGNADATIRDGSHSDPGSQANSVLYHGTSALGENNEGAHRQAGNGFDTMGENKGTMAIRPDKPDRRSVALAAKIPKEAWKDPLVGQLYGNFKKLSAIKDDTLNSIAALKQQQKNGKGDPAVNAAQLSMLNTRLKDTNKGMAEKEKEIKVEVTLNKGLKWDEGDTDSAPAKKTDATHKKTDTTDQTTGGN